MRIRHFALAALGLAALGLAATVEAATVEAATFQPTRFDDPAPDGCLPADRSLREAVIAANGTAATDSIVLSAGD